jgi:nitrogen fixation NifU-like protein
MDDLYRDQIIDRYKNPRHKGELDPHDYTYEDDNPLCGDRIRIDVRVGPDGRVTDAAFSGVGCAISQASADLLTETIVGRSLDEVKRLGKDDILELLGRPRPGAAEVRCCRSRSSRPASWDRLGRRRTHLGPGEPVYNYRTVEPTSRAVPVVSQTIASGQRLLLTSGIFAGDLNIAEDCHCRHLFPRRRPVAARSTARRIERPARGQPILPRARPPVRRRSATSRPTRCVPKGQILLILVE